MASNKFYTKSNYEIYSTHYLHFILNTKLFWGKVKTSDLKVGAKLWPEKSMLIKKSLI